MHDTGPIIVGASKTRVPFTDLIDLASELFGGRVLAATDDFFAGKENLILASEPVFIPGKYTEFGKWMDGWESRRKRNLRPGYDHDWCVLKLGQPGVIRGVNIDTAHFLGNFPEFASLEAVNAPDEKSVPDMGWEEILPASRLEGGARNLFPISSSKTWTHLRLRIKPDGGVARLRVYGDVTLNIAHLKEFGDTFDLAAASNGAKVVACNDMFFGQKDNLIMPGRAKVMGEGWETRRRRGPGYDWIIVRLATSGCLKKIEVDTNHYKGNFPESCQIEACSYPLRNLESFDFRDRTDLVWKEVLPRTQLKADTQHYFENEITGTGPFDYIRLNIFPDGGVSRLRIHGCVASSASATGKSK